MKKIENIYKKEENENYTKLTLSDNTFKSSENIIIDIELYINDINKGLQEAQIGVPMRYYLTLYKLNKEEKVYSYTDLLNQAKNRIVIPKSQIKYNGSVYTGEIMGYLKVDTPGVDIFGYYNNGFPKHRYDDITNAFLLNEGGYKSIKIIVNSQIAASKENFSSKTWNEISAITTAGLANYFRNGETKDFKTKTGAWCRAQIIDYMYDDDRVLLALYKIDSQGGKFISHFKKEVTFPRGYITTENFLESEMQDAAEEIWASFPDDFTTKAKLSIIEMDIWKSPPINAGIYWWLPDHSDLKNYQLPEEIKQNIALLNCDYESGKWWGVSSDDYYIKVDIQDGEPHLFNFMILCCI